MKGLAICLMLICMVVTARSQSSNSSAANRQCTLTVGQAPEIRGVHLGMSVEKLLTTFPGDANHLAIENALITAKQADNYGMGRFTFDRNGNASNPNFANVNYISITLLDEKVSGLYVQYVGPEWKTVEQFVSRLSDAFHLLPAENWEGAPGPNRTLKCDGFQVQAFTNPGSIGSSVGLSTVSAAQTVADRREAAKEKVRAAFKP